MSDVKCQMSYLSLKEARRMKIESWESDVRCQMSNVKSRFENLRMAGTRRVIPLSIHSWEIQEWSPVRGSHLQTATWCGRREAFLILTGLTGLARWQVRAF